MERKTSRLEMAASWLRARSLFLLGLLAASLAFHSAAAEETPAKPPQPARQSEERHIKHEPVYEKRSFRGSNSAELKYGWLTPLQMRAGERYPLVICLHGSGGSVRASSVLAQPKMREQYPAFVLVGECELPMVWAESGLKRTAGDPDRPEKLPVLLEAIRAVLHQEAAIDPARVYLIGQSMGGVGTWGAIARAPELFAAGVPICGLWKVEEVPRMVSVPVWAFHGSDDPRVPVTFSRELTAALNKAGGAAKYTEYAGVGHDSWTKACDDPAMWAWLFAQRKAASAK